MSSHSFTVSDIFAHVAREFIYGDVVEGMLMRSQPIQGVRDSLKGKGGLFIFL